MNEFVGTRSVVALTHTEQDTSYFLTSPSPATNTLLLEPQPQEFTACLFQLIIANTAPEQDTPVEFDQWVALKHIHTHKYLSVSSTHLQNNDTVHQLGLAHVPHQFKVQPCHQYQTKISPKVKFNEGVTLTSEYSSRMGTVVAERNSEQGLQLWLGFGKGAKLSFHPHSQLVKEDTGIMGGQVVWLAHIQSGQFLKGWEKEVSCGKIRHDRPLQQMAALWTIETNNNQRAEPLSYNEQIRFRHLLSRKYLSFSKHYKRVDNQRQYEVQLDERGGQTCKFILQSIREGQEKKVRRQAYVALMQVENGMYVGVGDGKNRPIDQPISLPFMDDGHLFAVRVLNSKQEKTLRMVMGVGEWLKATEDWSQKRQSLGEIKLMEEVYDNLVSELTSLKDAPQIMLEMAKDFLSPSIRSISLCLPQYRTLAKPNPNNEVTLIQEHANHTLTLAYQILRILCKGSTRNQHICLEQAECYLSDLAHQRGAEQLLIEIFGNNRELLLGVARPPPGKKNIIRGVLDEFMSRKRSGITISHESIRKLISLLQTLLFFKVTTIDANQALLGQSLFGKEGCYEQVLVPLRVQGDSLLVSIPGEPPIRLDEIVDSAASKLVQSVFGLLGSMVQNHCLSSKMRLHQYLSFHNQSCQSVLIRCLSRPLPNHLYDQLLRVITHTYVDSLPRLPPHRPLSFIFFKMEQHDPVQAEQQYYSQQLREALLMKAKESRGSQPLKHPAMFDPVVGNEPSMRQEQLLAFRMGLTDKLLQSRQWTRQQLGAVLRLMQLECYSKNEVLQLWGAVKGRLSGGINDSLLEQLLGIIGQVQLIAREEEIKKMTLFLKHKFNQQQEPKTSEYGFMLPMSRRIPSPLVQSSQSNHSQHYMQIHPDSPSQRSQYNNLRDYLSLLHPDSALQNILLSRFCRPVESYSCHLPALFNAIVSAQLPVTLFLRTVSNSTILTHEEVEEFYTLHNHHKQIQYLSKTSQHWLTSDDAPQQPIFVKALQELTRFMLEDPHSPISISPTNMKKQLLVANLQTHPLILQLLHKHHYLLIKTARKDLSRRLKETITTCMQFMQCLIRNCPQNKHRIYEYFEVIAEYQSCIELGQIKVYLEFYKDEKEFVREISYGFLKGVFDKITSGVGDYGCKYNPEYPKFLIALIETLGSESKGLLDQIFGLITRDDNMRLLFFMDELSRQRNQFCLKMHRYKIDPCQVPFIYHRSLISLILIILQGSSETVKKGLRHKVAQFLSLEYLLTVLALPDVFSNMGIEARLNFVIKEPIIQLICMVHLQRSESWAALASSQALKKLLDSYHNNILRKPQRKQLVGDNETLFMPYLDPLDADINRAIDNKKQYYTTTLQPFLHKLVSTFRKQNTREKNPLRDYLFTLTETMDGELEVQLIHKATSHRVRNIQEYKLPWRNFVDDDEDNSREEKYAKKVILDVLTSQYIRNAVEEERRRFHRAIRAHTQEFLGSTLKLLQMMLGAADFADGRNQQTKAVGLSLEVLSNFISCIDGEAEVKMVCRLLDSQHFMRTVLQLSTKPQFQLGKVHLKQIFYHCLLILNFRITHDHDHKTKKALYRMLREINYHKFLVFLKQGSQSIIESIYPLDHRSQINNALTLMHFPFTDTKPILYGQSYRLLTVLCRHEPFTGYFRSQQSSLGDIDFLDKIYNVLTFIFKGKQIGHQINVSSVQAAELILDFVCGMLAGGNKANQIFILDSKFAQLANALLKVQTMPQAPLAAERAQDIDKIIEFYQSNGIDIAGLLQSQVQMVDFRHDCLLQRFKLILLKALSQTLIGNINCLIKIKLEVPIEIIKLNLMWVYEEFKASGRSYEETLLLRQRQDWRELVQDSSLLALHLRIGFYCYQLIMAYKEEEVEADSASAEENSVFDEQKEKERIVKVFFSKIRQPKRNKTHEKLISKQNQGDQMKQQYQLYYQGLDFFASNTATVQVTLKQTVLSILFPLIPLTYKITPQMQQDFRTGVNRLSRQEKIKSLIEYQRDFYDELDREQKYIRGVGECSSILQGLLSLMRHESEWLLSGWIVSLVICIVYLVENFYRPTYQLTPNFFAYITPRNPLRAGLLVLSVISCIIGTLLGVRLFFRKLPLRLGLLSLQYQRRKSGRGGGWQDSEFVWVWSRLLRSVFYDLYMTTFMILAVLHPFFSAFPLVDIVHRIGMGRFIIKSIRQTWTQLLVAVALLVVFNFIYSQLVYDFFTPAPGYGAICEKQSLCLRLFIDQNLKADAGVMGAVDANYVDMSLNMQVICEVLYVLIGLKVIVEIFSGTIIDKFSELREQQEEIEKDDATICLICGQQRFDLDLQYQGFQKHITQNHSPVNYFKYIFYLRRCPLSELGFIDNYVWECHGRGSQQWIPQETSVVRQEKEQSEEGSDVVEEGVTFCRGKMKDMKMIQQRVRTIMQDIQKPHPSANKQSHQIQ